MKNLAEELEFEEIDGKINISIQFNISLTLSLYPKNNTLLSIFNSFTLTSISSLNSPSPTSTKYALSCFKEILLKILINNS